MEMGSQLTHLKWLLSRSGQACKMSLSSAACLALYPITSPLHRLTQPQQTSECAADLFQLHCSLAEAPKLAYPEKSLTVDTDASNTGLGVVLS